MEYIKFIYELSRYQNGYMGFLMTMLRFDERTKLRDITKKDGGDKLKGT